MSLPIKHLFLPAAALLAIIFLIPDLIKLPNEAHQPIEWKQLPGSALEIDISMEGVAWAISKSGTVNMWDGQKWQDQGADAVRLSAGPRGNTWIIDKQHRISRWTGNGWVRMPGKAMDIGIGASGRIWMIGTEKKPGGFGVYKWGATDWVAEPGAGIRIAVGPKGNPWIINDENKIYRLTRDIWKQAPGHASDIAIGANGVPWIIDLSNGAAGDVYGWTGLDWDLYASTMAGIATDPRSRPWVFNAKNEIFAHPKSQALTIRP